MFSSKLMVPSVLLIALEATSADFSMQQQDPSSLLQLMSVLVNITRAHCGLPLFLCCSSELQEFEHHLYERARLNTTRIVVPHELDNLTACMKYHQDIQIHPENALQDISMTAEPKKADEESKSDSNGNIVSRFFTDIYGSVYNFFSTSSGHKNSNNQNRRKREVHPEYESGQAQMLMLLVDITFQVCPTSRFEYRPYYIESLCKGIDINTPLKRVEQAELHHLFNRIRECKLVKLEMPNQCFAC